MTTNGIIAAILVLACANAHAFSKEFCDGVAEKVDATVGLKERGASGSEALQIAEISGAGQSELGVDRMVIRQVYEFPSYRGLTRAQIVKKGRPECRALKISDAK